MEGLVVERDSPELIVIMNSIHRLFYGEFSSGKQGYIFLNFKSAYLPFKSFSQTIFPHRPKERKKYDQFR